MKTTLALAVLAWSASTAFAQGDAHMANKPTYDASKVEERAFGREGEPRKVTRTNRLDMIDAFRFTPADVTVQRGEAGEFQFACLVPGHYEAGMVGKAVVK